MTSVGANLMFALELKSIATIVRGRTQGSPLHELLKKLRLQFKVCPNSYSVHPKKQKQNENNGMLA
jgi:hypothetical protein